MRKILLSIGIALVAMACGDGRGYPATAPSDISYAGTYLLSSVDGIAVPGTVSQDQTGRLEVTGGELVLRSDNTFRRTVSRRFVQSNGQVATQTEEENGTYSAMTGAIMLTVPVSGSGGLVQPGSPKPNSYSYHGRVSGPSVIFEFDASTLLYRK